MLRILVVDDELPIRQGLAVIITDFGRQFEVVGEAADGQEALALMGELQPDLVITDIKMPNLDGIELVKKMSERYPHIKKVVLSGFDEFEFVREVMKEGVLDYLLKPIVEAQLHERLTKIHADIETERKRERDSLNLNIKLNESMPLLRDQFLEQIVCLTKNGARREAAEKLIYYNIHVIEGMHFVILVQLDNSRYLQESMGTEQMRINQFIVKNIAQESAAAYGQCHSFYHESQLVLLCSVKDGGSFAEVRSGISRDVFQNLSKYARMRFSLGIGNAVTQFYEVGDSYESALTALEYRFYQTGSSAIDTNAERLAFVSTYSPKTSMELQKGWLDGLVTGEFRKIAEAFDAFCHYHSNQLTLPSLVLYELANTFHSLQSENVKFRESILDCFGKGFSYEKFLDRFDTLDEIRKQTVNLFEEALRKMQEMTQKREKKYIQQVKEYINEHFREEITLGKMSELVFINANYLSELFKTQCGITFIDYVTQVRIDKAKRLLKNSSIKTYAVGEMVGYEDPAYFSKVFKKMIGVSPSEYRNLID